MVEIFAIVVCVTFSDPAWAKANSCSLGSRGETFATAEQCKAMLSRLPGIKTDNNGATTEYRCVSKTTPAWKPVD